MTELFDQCYVGTTLEGMATLESLEIPEPQSDFDPFADYKEMANAYVKGRGLPVGSWSWGYLEAIEREAARDEFPDLNNVRYIHTCIKEGDAYATYKVLARWPHPEKRDMLLRTNFVIDFIFMELQAEPPDPPEGEGGGE